MAWRVMPMVGLCRGGDPSWLSEKHDGKLIVS